MNICDSGSLIFICGISDHCSHQKLKTKEMTENYSGRTTFGDIDFTEDQIEEYKMVFAEFDIDGDGNISVQVTENFNDLNKNLGIYRKSFLKPESFCRFSRSILYTYQEFLSELIMVLSCFYIVIVLPLKPKVLRHILKSKINYIMG